MCRSRLRIKRRSHIDADSHAARFRTDSDLNAHADTNEYTDSDSDSDPITDEYSYPNADPAQRGTYADADNQTVAVVL